VPLSNRCIVSGGLDCKFKRVLATLQVEAAVVLANTRMPKVVEVMMALREMRRQAGQSTIVNRMAKPSVDAFVYSLQRAVIMAVARKEISPREACDYVSLQLIAAGWKLCPEMHQALSDLFPGKQ
jgi:hypothetical protein